MLAFDSVKLRLDRQQELSFLEFNYMILQGLRFRRAPQAARLALQMGLRPVEHILNASSSGGDDRCAVLSRSLRH